MISFIMGTAGVGKSTLIYEKVAEELKNGKKIIYLALEQQAVESEQAIADITENINTLGLEVLNFKRLSNRVFRVYGGLSYNNISRGARLVIMWQVLSELSPELDEYKDVSLSDRQLISLLLDMIKEFKQSGISPELLEKAANELKANEESEGIARKLSDIALIFSGYEAVLHGSFDDPSDDITRAAEKLKEHASDGENFFEGYNVYIDGFDGFTKQEYEIIRQIMRLADNVIISLCLEHPTKKHNSFYDYERLDGLFNDNIIFDGVKKTEKCLRKLAEDEGCGEIDEIMLYKAKRYKNDELLWLHDNLWNFASTFEPYSKKTEHIKLIECRNIFSEAEYIAEDILKRVRDGERYKDMALIVHDISLYRGIIDAVFEKYGIPFFMSERTELASKPLYRFIFSLFSIYIRNFSRSDVISYLKSGLAPVTRDECDIFETYTKIWNINGRRFIDEYDWNMNPDGYTDKLSESGAQILVEVNDIRRRITTPIIKFFECFDSKSTVRSISEALYEFLNDCGVRKRILSKNKQEEVHIWNLFMETLDQLVMTAPDMHTNADTYIQMFSAVLGETDAGAIPPVFDKVIIGNAGNVRLSEIETVYISGLNEGVFPAGNSRHGIFSERDFEFLSEIGINFGITPEERETGELFYFYRAAACARSNVIFLYSAFDFSGKPQKPSIAVRHIKSLFNELSAESFPPDVSDDDKLSELVEGYEASLEYAAYYSDRAVGMALHEIYESDEEFCMRLEAAKMPLNVTNEKLDVKTADKLFGKNLSLTQSRLDSYVLCKFSYFCKYHLKLSESRRASFNGADVGNFVHRILEMFISSAMKDGKLDCEMDEVAINTLLDEIINDYIFAVCGGEASMSNRLIQLFRRLKRTSVLLVKNLFSEFRQSSFVPRFFELPIEFGNPDAATPFSVSLPDGSEAYIYGKIDRVDTYKNDGKVYVRVVDYKTGSRDFSLSDIALGLNLQMLLYLFSLWQNKNPHLDEKMECYENDEILPAGVIYFGAKNPDIMLDCETGEEEANELAAGKISRKGLFLANREVIEAMDESLSGKYVPIKLNKDGKFASSASLATLEQFGEYMEQISDTIKKIGIEMKNGYADAIPLDSKRHDPCKYCHLKPVCRN